MGAKLKPTVLILTTLPLLTIYIYIHTHTTDYFYVYIHTHTADYFAFSTLLLRTQAQALDFIGAKIKPTKFGRRTAYNKADEAREKLATVVVSHVPVHR